MQSQESRRWRTRTALFVFSVLAFVLNNVFSDARAEAREWRRVELPGAKCGDGADYGFFVSPGNSRKLMVDFMGGGACWSGETCWGPVPLTWIHPLPIVVEGLLPRSGILSESPLQSPVHDYTVIYLPYCTGDVHIGSHVAKYWGLSTHHVGRSNFEIALKWMMQSSEVEWSALTHFVAYGASAGAIAAMVHSKAFDSALPRATERILIADAPGLHFGPSFWDKFTPQLRKDFKAALKLIGFDLQVGAQDGIPVEQPGNLARAVPLLCRNLPNWRVGVLQGSLDLVMSRVFGELSPGAHEAMVYGENGVYQLTQDPRDQCAAFIPRTPFHTFFVLDSSADLDATGKTAREFVFDQVQGRGGVNYR